MDTLTNVHTPTTGGFITSQTLAKNAGVTVRIAYAQLNNGWHLQTGQFTIILNSRT